MTLIFINDFLLQVHPLTMAEHKLLSMVEQMIACSICVDVLDKNSLLKDKIGDVNFHK